MNLVIIGTGNVATSLGTAFLNAGHTILQVAGRNRNSTQKLSTLLKALPVFLPHKVLPNADFYIIAVKDDAIEEMSAYTAAAKGIVVHTSGAVPLHQLTKHHLRAGVLYPLDTISHGNPESYKNVPICIEGSKPAVTTSIKKLAATVSDKVYKVSSEQRALLHLAAVFANNFTNYIFSLSGAIMRNGKLPEALLHELIRSTARNAIHPGPDQSQTGPAVRNDKVTIQKHQKLLSGKPELRAIYKLLTNDIVKASSKRKVKTINRTKSKK
ncbi:MAG TPA: Rossmann-like and DUF2520 domain-containing protein [Bacteroidia bacterium]|nr:Rossmann-like and DUF2520 domain-containing protein [Bacteroidia bacterium]